MSILVYARSPLTRADFRGGGTGGAGGLAPLGKGDRLTGDVPGVSVFAPHFLSPFPFFSFHDGEFLTRLALRIRHQIRQSPRPGLGFQFCFSLTCPSTPPLWGAAACPRRPLGRKVEQEPGGRRSCTPAPAVISFPLFFPLSYLPLFPARDRERGPGSFSLFAGNKTPVASAGIFVSFFLPFFFPSFPPGPAGSVSGAP